MKPNRGGTMPEREHKKGDKLDTKFGIVTVLSCEKGKIVILIDDDITATFQLREFNQDFVI